MYYFYVLESKKDGNFYYGCTADLKRRYEEHTKGNVTSTSHRRRLNLVYYEAYRTKIIAHERELVVKRSISARRTLHNRIT